MRKLFLLCLSLYATNLPFAQPVFQTSLLAGVSIPLASNGVNGTYNGSGIHFGNSLDILMGSGALRFGLGTYIGFLDALGSNTKYRQVAQAIAEKYGMSAQGLVYHSSPFTSTHIMLGPVASFEKKGLGIHVWAKGGYGINEPGQYSVTYKDVNLSNNIYVNQSGENRNGLSYSLGGGIRYALSDKVGLQLTADYFNTKTDLVNYNFDREKGTQPLYSSANNAYLQASAGLVFTIGGLGENGPGKKVVRNKQDGTGQDGRRTDGVNSNAVDQAEGRESAAGQEAGKNKSGEDTLYFSPDKLVIKTARQTQKRDFGERSIQPLSSVNNFLTGFVYRTSNGPVIGQCGPSAMMTDPIPGVDVHLFCEGCNVGLPGRTNTDGSFSINNIPPGNYRAVVGNDTVAVSIRNYNANPGYSILQQPVNECTLANNVVYAENKLYVEVIAAREASSGMASGRRTVALIGDPLPVSNMDFEVNWKNIISNEGKLYAEVVIAREANSGMASGRRTMITGDLDGDGIAETSTLGSGDRGTGSSGNESVVPGDGDTYMVHLHKEGVIHRDLAARSVMTPGGSSAPAPSEGVGNNPLYQGEGGHGTNPVYTGNDEVRPASPLYEGGGTKGENPLYETKSNLRVAGSNGKEHSLVLPTFVDLKTVITTSPNPGSTFDCSPIVWLAGRQKPGNGSNQQRASINTTRSNIKHQSRIACLGGACSVDCVVEVGGVEYDAVMTGKFKKG